MNAKDRIDILNKVIDRLCEIKGCPNNSSKHRTELRLIAEARALYKSIEWGNAKDMVYDKVMLFNVIFLKRYENFK